MDDFLVCSDLCEECGFLRQAEALRRIAAGQGKAYIVLERGYEYNDYTYDVDPRGEPRALFFDRGEAEREALRRDGRKFREEGNPLKFCADLREISELQEADLARQIGAILKVKRFRLPTNRFEYCFPTDATDEQMVEVVKLFTLRFFYVVEVDFAG